MSKQNEIKSLSLVLPVFKQEETIIENISLLKNTLDRLPFPVEIIVVVDGFVDKTYSKLIEKKFDGVKVLGYEHNEGKGFAVRYGMLQAESEVIGFIDAGMDIDPSSVGMVVNHMIWYKADVIIGSKLHPVSQVDYPFVRKILSWGYRSMIRILFGLRIRDTQVGLKLFRKKVVKDVFPRLLVKSFAFDIEILAVSYDRGYKRIFESPIKLNFNNSSSIIGKNFWRTIYLMMVDTLAVFYRLKILHHYDKSESIQKI